MLPITVKSLVCRRIASAGVDILGFVPVRGPPGLSYARAAFSTSTAKRSLDISGIYPPIATPFNQDESIAYDKLQHNMDMWNKIPFRGK